MPTVSRSRRAVRRTATLALLAALVPAAAGCGGGGGDGDQSTDGAGKPSASDEPGPGAGELPASNVIVTAWCTVPASSPATVQVEGWDPKTWQSKGKVSFTVPANAVYTPDDGAGTGLAELCASSVPGAMDSEDEAGVAPTELRQMFDANFTRMAVVLRDPETDGTRVGFVDRDGKLTELGDGTDGGGFGSTPSEENAVFAPDGKRVWFTHQPTEEQVAIASRPVTGDHARTDHVTADATDLDDGVALALTEAPVRGVLGQNPRLSPDGARVSAFITFGGYNVLPVPAESALLTQVEGGRPVPFEADCMPQGWVDATTLLCGPRMGPADEAKRANSFWTLDVSNLPTDDGKPLRPGVLSEPLLPATDRENTARALSPDGSRFLFVSQQGNQRKVFTLGTTPGQEPQELPKEAAQALRPNVSVLQWR